MSYTFKYRLNDMKNTQCDMKYVDGMSCVERAMKRLFDILCSFVGLILLSPLLAYIYIRIRLNGDGPVLFKQERIGYKGKTFKILKYRTMSVCDDEETPLLFSNEDDRLTPFGRFLRERHLDELPQLWNVLVGDMSFVGPRPERKYFIDRIIQHNSDYVYIYKMRPGLTSPASIYNGYTDTMEKMLRRLDMDLEYLQQRNFFYDLKIITLTIVYILKGKKI